MKKFWKVVKVVLLVLLALIVLIAAVITVFAVKNNKQVKACIETTLAEVSENHTVREIDTGDYGEMTMYGVLKVHSKQYEIEDLGNLSVMTVNAGVMQMATVIFSPFDKDLPLLSCDYMYMLSNRTAYVEFYDLVEIKTPAYMKWMERYEELRTRYGDLEDTEASSGWYDYLITVAIYKKAAAAQDARAIALLGDAVSLYMDQADACPLLDAEARQTKIAAVKAYSDRLIDEGGVSTSLFKAALGEEVTRDFFDQVFFGTAKAKAMAK